MAQVRGMKVVIREHGISPSDHRYLVGKMHKEHIVLVLGARGLD